MHLPGQVTVRVVTYQPAVTAELIKANNPMQGYRATHCPVVTAVNNVLPGGEYAVSGGDGITVMDREKRVVIGYGRLPREARDALFRLDAGCADVLPFTFSIKIRYGNCEGMMPVILEGL